MYTVCKYDAMTSLSDKVSSFLSPLLSDSEFIGALLLFCSFTACITSVLASRKTVQSVIFLQQFWPKGTATFHDLKNSKDTTHDMSPGLCVLIGLELGEPCFPVRATSIPSHVRVRKALYCKEFIPSGIHVGTKKQKPNKKFNSRSKNTHTHTTRQVSPAGGRRSVTVATVSFFVATPVVVLFAAQIQIVQGAVVFHFDVSLFHKPPAEIHSNTTHIHSATRT